MSDHLSKVLWNCSGCGTQQVFVGVGKYARAIHTYHTHIIPFRSSCMYILYVFVLTTNESGDLKDSSH